MQGEKLELSKSECEAVQSYIWNACRSSPTGKAYKTWKKMWAFICDAPEEKPVKVDTELPLFTQEISA